MEENGNTKTETRSIKSEVRLQVLGIISRMNLEKSTKLPSENQLTKRLHVSRSTVRSVLSDLEAEGKVTRYHGSGTFVNSLTISATSTIYPQLSTFDMIEGNGYVASSKEIYSRRIPVDERGITRLQLKPGDMMTELVSIYYASGVPCMYCIDCMIDELSQIDWKKRGLDKMSIYAFIRQETGVDIRQDIVSFVSAESSDLPGLNECFGVEEGKSKPLVCMKMQNFDIHGRPVLYGNIYVDTDIIQLNVVRSLVNV